MICESSKLKVRSGHRQRRGTFIYPSTSHKAPSRCRKASFSLAWSTKCPSGNTFCLVCLPADTPICKSHQRVVYTAARAEEVDVSCEVESHPSLVTFLWLFNSSLQSHQVDSIHWNGTQSTARYAAHSGDDYGTLLCWARNEVGRQEQPCVFLIVPQG